MRLFKRSPELKKSPVQRASRLIFWSFFTWLIVRSCVVQFYKVPTGSMNNTLKEGDYIVVNKLAYGPRLPMTPLSLPFGHTYVEWISWSYYRFPGYSSIQRNDMLVFNYPAEKNTPIDHRKEYVKRCIALAGDVVEIRKGMVFVNGKKQAEVSTGLPLYDKKRPRSALDSMAYNPAYFPHSGSVRWNADQFGPLYVPKKGQRIRLTSNRLLLYKDVIEHFEHKKIVERNGKVYIDNTPQKYYVFELDYYFVLGDNRANSIDSRFWGFVPEDHIIGKVVYSF